jgi:hypothetical protein
VQPAGIILEAEVSEDRLSKDDFITTNPPLQRRRPKRSKAAQPNKESGNSIAIDFSHAPEKFGNPSQGWKTKDKSIWLLYVLREGSSIGEVSGRSISETFNKHFKQSGTITASNVQRDLGRAKVNEPKSGSSRRHFRLRIAHSQGYEPGHTPSSGSPSG